MLQLPEESGELKAAQCAQLKYLQNIPNIPENVREAHQLLAEITAFIDKTNKAADEGADYDHSQLLVNMAVRAYYQLLEKFELEDSYLDVVTRVPLTHAEEHEFKILYALLQTNHWQRLDPIALKEQSLVCLNTAIENNSKNSLLILKVLNLLARKCPMMDMELNLDDVYHCMQSGAHHMREETLVLFRHCCKNTEYATGCFHLISQFWPWTNRAKFYLLSCVLNTHKLRDLLTNDEELLRQFFAGMRLSLNYKCLHAASQYLVKSLSMQESHELLELAAEILTRGTIKELENFYAQWYSRIQQNDTLFEMLQQKSEIQAFLSDSLNLVEHHENYRLILIFSMFSRHIFMVSKLHFFKISTEFITNCFKFSHEAQLLIYRFIVDNLSCFAIEDCLDFMVAFIKQHRSVDSTKFRNTLLGKVSTVINHISKTFSRVNPAVDSSTLEASITAYFQQLQHIVETDIGSSVYQPKIFALKLLSILLRSLYLSNVEKNAKNCSVTQNQKLGAFLISRQVFDASAVSAKLLTVLNEPAGFDDALDLTNELLKDMHYASTNLDLEFCKQICKRANIDECALSARFAIVVAHAAGGCRAELYLYALQTLEAELEDFKSDPLLVCKSRNHLFGYLGVLNELVLLNAGDLPIDCDHLLQVLDKTLNIVLELLNMANLRRGEVDTSPAGVASFQDMDESLQLLVQESKFACESASYAAHGKYLLMSFWLTLKGCCDLATSLGCYVIHTHERAFDTQLNLNHLEQSVGINFTVLTRCRHKGAIESAGLSIGKLTKCITERLSTNAAAYALLHNCLSLALQHEKQVSITRRGAGFAIMFLHIIKNEQHSQRPLLQQAVTTVLKRLQAVKIDAATATNYDSTEALFLHYLCVLVKDTDLRLPLSEYHGQIMLAAIKQIDNPDWSVCNAALQLFGALVPKIVGQKQATEYDEPLDWVPTEVTYSEILTRLPGICEYMLFYCATKSRSTSSTRSIILFLAFLSQVEHLRKCATTTEARLVRIRELMWKAMQHQCAQVRQLAAICFVRSHEFRCDLPHVLLQISNIVFGVRNENFFEGLILTLHVGILKLQHEAKFTVLASELSAFMEKLRKSLSIEFDLQPFKLFTYCRLLDLLALLEFDRSAEIVRQLLSIEAKEGTIGYDEWQRRVKEFS